MPLLLCEACEVYFASDEVRGSRSPPCPRCGAPVSSSSIVPTDEMESVTLTLSDALEYAASGKRAVGYALLIRGLTRAEGLLTDGKPWAPQLLGCWREAIDRYSQRMSDEDESDETADVDDAGSLPERR